MLSIQRESMFRQKNSRSEIIAMVLVLSYCLVLQNREEDKNLGKPFTQSVRIQNTAVELCRMDGEKVKQAPPTDLRVLK